MAAIASIDETLEYKIKFNDLNKKCIHVEAFLPTEEDGVLTVQVPQSGIASLKINSSYIKIENVSPLFKRFTFEAQKKIGFQYELCMSEVPFGDIDYPFLNERFFSILVYSALIFPDYPNEKEVKVKISLENLEPDFKLFGPNGNISKDIAIQDTVDRFSTYILLGTKDDIFDIEVRGKHFFAVTNNKDISLSSEKIEKYRNILSFQMSLMNDFDSNPSLLFFLVKPNADLYARHFTNTLSLLMPVNPSNEMLMRAFSHEYFHRWLGIKMRADEHLGDLLWFIEGVNDFFGIEATYLTDSVTFQEYLNIVNDILKEYYLSPISQLDYDFLSSKIYDDFQYRKTAQVRGYLASFAVDVIERGDLIKHPFIKAIKNILNKSTKDDISLTPLMVFENIKNNLEESKWEETKSFINTGINIKLPDEIYNERAKLINYKIAAADYGFDLEKLFNEKLIADLDKDSQAYKIGLRDGMTVLYHDIAFSRPSAEITMYVSENNEVLKFNFVPSFKYKSIPQYIINPKNKERFLGARKGGSVLWGNSNKP